MLKNFFNSQNIVKFNFLISMSSFSFQIYILNPWHKKISKQIENLEKNFNNIK